MSGMRAGRAGNAQEVGSSRNRNGPAVIDMEAIAIIIEFGWDRWRMMAAALGYRRIVG
jgi:hypothetical protein